MGPDTAPGETTLGRKGLAELGMALSMKVGAGGAEDDEAAVFDEPGAPLWGPEGAGVPPGVPPGDGGEDADPLEEPEGLGPLKPGPL